jgi:hypothetical protein
LLESSPIPIVGILVFDDDDELNGSHNKEDFVDNSEDSNNSDDGDDDGDELNGSHNKEDFVDNSKDSNDDDSDDFDSNELGRTTYGYDKTLRHSNYLEKCRPVVVLITFISLCCI